MLPLRGGSCEVEPDEGKLKVFSVSVRSVKLYVAAETDAVRTEWIRSIRKTHQAMCASSVPACVSLSTVPWNATLTHLAEATRVARPR